MDMPNEFGPRALLERGLVAEEGQGIGGRLLYERPAWPHGHRLKDCSVGAFGFFNAAGMTSAYRTHFGRYTQIGESSIIGPPEHPQDYFSSHPFAFTRPQYLPNMYQLPDFARLAPERSAAPSYVDTVPSDTFLGHETYIGARTFIKRGVTIGDGASIGAGSVVTRDIPAYAIAVGSPAKVIRLRFDDAIVERFMKLQWWRYDLAPYKQQVDFSQVEATLEFFEQRVAEGQLSLLRPDSYSVTRQQSGLVVEKLAEPLFD